VALGRDDAAALWASWQLGTIAGLLGDASLRKLPREGIGVLVFGCIALSQWRRTRRGTP
jgi:predicted branched-subunit amino acid permease